MKFTTYEEKIVRMRKKDNSYISTLLNEAIKWNIDLDEILVLCDVLRILDKYNLGVSKNEVRKAFNKYYDKNDHGDKKSYLARIYKDFGIKDKITTFTAQARKPIFSNEQKDEVSENIVIPHTKGVLIASVDRLLPSSKVFTQSSTLNAIPPSNEVISIK